MTAATLEAELGFSAPYTFTGACGDIHDLDQAARVASDQEAARKFAAEQCGLCVGALVAYVPEGNKAEVIEIAKHRQNMVE